jgi:hypothetical protein
VITDVGNEDLGLVFEPAKSPRMEDAVAIPLESQTQVIGLLWFGTLSRRLV